MSWRNVVVYEMPYCMLMGDKCHCGVSEDELAKYGRILDAILHVDG